MGRLNEMLGAAAQYSRGIAVQFGLEEQEGVPTVAPELVPVADIHARPEMWHLHGGSLLWGKLGVGQGGAGTRSQSAIEPGIGELVIVESIVIEDDSDQFWTISLSSTPLSGSTGNLVPRDARRIVTTGGGGTSGTRIRQQNNVAIGGIATEVMKLRCTPAATKQQIWLDCVLVSPWSLRFYPDADNTALPDHTIFARSRPGTPREIALGAI
jgi:hypothetical protein